MKLESYDQTKDFHKTINFYNTSGEVTGELTFPEPIKWLEGRISVGVSGLYYKGSGTWYRGHCRCK